MTEAKQKSKQLLPKKPIETWASEKLSQYIHDYADKANISPEQSFAILSQHIMTSDPLQLHSKREEKPEKLIEIWASEKLSQYIHDYADKANISPEQSFAILSQHIMTSDPLQLHSKREEKGITKHHSSLTGPHKESSRNTGNNIVYLTIGIMSIMGILAAVLYILSQSQ